MKQAVLDKRELRRIARVVDGSLVQGAKAFGRGVTQDVASFNCGILDYEVRIRIRKLGASPAEFDIRDIDSSNKLFLQIHNTNQCRLYKRVGGALTTPMSNVFVQNGDVISLRVQGKALTRKVIRNGAIISNTQIIDTDFEHATTFSFEVGGGEYDYYVLNPNQVKPQLHYVVDGDNGSDLNNGKDTQPWATIQHALSTIDLDKMATVHVLPVASGEYAEEFSGAINYLYLTRAFEQQITVDGKDRALSDLTSTGDANYCIRWNGGTNVYFKNFVITPPNAVSNGTLRVDTSARLGFIDCDVKAWVGSAGGSGLLVAPVMGASEELYVRFEGCDLRKHASESESIKLINLSCGAGRVELDLIETTVEHASDTASDYGVRVIQSDAAADIMVRAIRSTVNGTDGYPIWIFGGGFEFLDSDFSSNNASAVVLGAENGSSYATTGDIRGGSIASALSHAVLVGSMATDCNLEDIDIDAGNQGIVFKSCINCVADNVRVVSGTQVGVNFKGADGCSLINSRVEGSEGTLVFMQENDTPDPDDISQNNTVTDNVFVATGTAKTVHVKPAPDTGDGNVFDRNVHNLMGSSNATIGQVLASSGLTTLSALKSAWSGYGNGDNDNYSQVIPYTGEVVASFTTTVKGARLACTFTGMGATSYSWDFGDGSGSSTDENPTYDYASAGTFTVELTINGMTTVTADVTVVPLLLSPPDVTVGTWVRLVHGTAGVNEIQIVPGTTLTLNRGTNYYYDGTLEAEEFLGRFHINIRDDADALGNQGPDGNGKIVIRGLSLVQKDDNYDDRELRIGASGASETIDSTNWAAQSFALSSAGRVLHIQIDIPGSPTGTVDYEIQTDNAGSPSGTAVANSAGTLTLATGTNDIRYNTLSNEVELSDGVTYWFVLKSASGTCAWTRDTSSVYAGGVGKTTTDSGSSWSADGNDFNFNIICTPNYLDRFGVLIQDQEYDETPTPYPFTGEVWITGCRVGGAVASTVSGNDVTIADWAQNVLSEGFQFLLPEAKCYGQRILVDACHPALNLDGEFDDTFDNHADAVQVTGSGQNACFVFDNCSWSSGDQTWFYKGVDSGNTHMGARMLRRVDLRGVLNDNGVHQNEKPGWDHYRDLTDGEVALNSDHVYVFPAELTFEFSTNPDTNDNDTSSGSQGTNIRSTLVSGTPDYVYWERGAYHKGSYPAFTGRYINGADGTHPEGGVDGQFVTWDDVGVGWVDPVGVGEEWVLAIDQPNGLADLDTSGDALARRFIQAPDETHHKDNAWWIEWDYATPDTGDIRVYVGDNGADNAGMFWARMKTTDATSIRYTDDSYAQTELGSFTATDGHRIRMEWDDNVLTVSTSALGDFSDAVVQVTDDHSGSPYAWIGSGHDALLLVDDDGVADGGRDHVLNFKAYYKVEN